MFDLCVNRQTPYTADREEGEDLPPRQPSTFRHKALSSVPTWPPPVPLRCLAIPAVPASAFALFGHSRCPRQCLCAVWPFPLFSPVPLRCLAIPAVPASAFALFGHSRCPRQCLCAVWPFPLSPPVPLRCLAIPAVPAINCCISGGISGGRGGTCSASGGRPQSMW